MPDIIDYVTMVAPRTLPERPFDACDALAFAGVCYNTPDPAARGEEREIAVALEALYRLNEEDA